jgi:PAS domain S-box-containing protein
MSQKIMIVEDEEPVARVVRAILEQLGHEVIYLMTKGEGVLEKVKEQRPDLVIMDIMLKRGGTNGIEIARKIHQEFDIPVIFLTGLDDDKVFEMAKTAKPFGYVLKPFKYLELRAAVEMGLRNARAEAELKKHRNHLEELITERTVELEKVNRELLAEITEHKNAKKALQSSEVKYHRLHSTMREAFASVSMDGQIKEYNELFSILTGYSPEELQKLTYRDITHQRWHAMETEIIEQQVLVNGYSEVYEKEYTHKDGTVIPVELRTFLLRDDTGAPCGMWAVIRDITKRMQAKEALRMSEENYRNFIDSADVMVIVGSLDGKIVYTNPLMSSKLGYSPEELGNMVLLDLHPAENRREAAEIIVKMINGELNTCPLPLLQKDGAIIPVETHAWLGKWSEKDCIFGISKDLTKEQEALQKFNKLFSRNPSLMAVNDQEDGTFTDINDAFLDTLGYSREEVVGKTSAELDLFIQPEEQLKAQKQLMTTGKIVDCELKVKCKNGKILDGIFYGEILESQGKKSFLTVMLDITERRQAEEKIKASLNEKEILLREIHHRVKNNLQAVSSLLSLQAGQFHEPKQKSAYNQLRNRIKSMALVHEKLYTSKDMAYIEFGDHIRSIVKELVLAYGNDEMKVNVKADKITIDLEKAVPLSLILNELVTNALIHAFPGRNAGTLQITFRAAGNGNVELMVRDDGKGLPEDIDFGNMHTLGLALIDALVQQINGKMEISREKGTTFTIRFERMK